MQLRNQLKATAASAALLASSAVCAQPIAAGSSPEATTARADVGLAEIVVTAQKRAQNLMDVPVSVSAISADAIRANRIQNVLDLSAVVPNLTVRASPGGANLPTFVMRGVFSANGTPGSEKQIGYYLDGVYVGSAGGSAFDLGNIARIEVLRGPQGTLFGQNATAGAVSIYTADPTGKLGATLEGTIGNYDQRRFRASLDLPAIGPLSGYVAYEHFERRGDIRNEGAGTTWDYSLADPKLGPAARSPKYLGNINRETVQVALKLDPGSDVSATYKFFWVRNDATPEGMGYLEFNPAATPNRALYTQLMASQPDVFRRRLERPKSLNNWWVQPSHFKNHGHIGTIQWQASDDLSFKNTAGYLKSSYGTTNQLDGLGGLVNTIPALGPVGAPLAIFLQDSSQVNKQWSNELQMNLDTDFVNFTAGYLHYDYKGVQTSRGEASTSYAFRTIPNFLVPAATTPRRNSVHTKSDAIFGQAEFHITPQFDAVVGARYTWDNKLATTQLPRLIPLFRYKDSRASYSAGVNYKPNDDILIFGKYSKAYVAGGAFAGWTWEPEIAKSWEAGVKAELLDRRLRTTLTAFHVKYDDVQAVAAGTLLAAATGRSELAPIPSTIATSGDVRARGFEFEASAVPARGLTIGAGLSYTDTDLTRVAPLFGNSFDLTFRSKYTAMANIQYETQPILGTANLVFRVDANYRSKYDATQIKSTPFLESLFSPATTIVNGRVALTNVALQGGSLEIAGWVRNLTDEKQLSYPISVPFIVATTYERARTFGVDISLRY